MLKGNVGNIEKVLFFTSVFSGFCVIIVVWGHLFRDWPLCYAQEMQEIVRSIVRIRVSVRCRG